MDISMLSPSQSRELGLKIKSYSSKDLDLYYSGKIKREEYKKRANNSLVRQLRTYLLENDVRKLSELPSKFNPIVNIK